MQRTGEEEEESAEPTIDARKPHVWHRYEVAELGAMPRIDWLVDRLLPEKGLGQLYGPPKSHKTFVALDMVLCIATGRPWRGRKVKRGRVIYVIGEGQSDLYDRVCAWCSANDVDVADLTGWFRAVINPVHVNDEQTLEAFGKLLRDAGEQFDLLVLDTVNRNMSGDENSTETMKGFVDGCDRLKAFFGCSVLVVHHTGHDKTRARGSSVLIAAVDVSVRVARVKENETLTRVSVEHIRAAPPGDELHFEPEHVALDFEDRRESVVLRLVDKPSPSAKAKPIPKATRDRIKLLIAIRDNPGESQRALAKLLGGAQSTVNERIKAMRQDGWLAEDSMTVTEEGHEFIAVYGPDAAGQSRT